MNVESGAKIKTPLYVVFVSTTEDAVSFPRISINAAAESSASLVEIHLGKEGCRYLSNEVIEARIGEGAHFEHTRLQFDSAEALHFSKLVFAQQTKSNFATKVLLFWWCYGSQRD